MTELPQKACWQARDVAAVISNEALEGHEGVFLATHTPITGFDVDGSHAADIADPDEQAVLEALSDPTRRHAFCVVQGEPGSGKSHLIRWLSVNWPIGSDVKLLLQRADGSLEGALRQLREQLREFADLFENLGQLHRATIQGRANMFLANLANALDPVHFDPPLEDVDWCQDHKPTELINHFQVREAWRGPSRILRLLEGKSRNDDQHERNSASATFDLFDIEELAGCCGNLYNSGVLPATERLARRLIGESRVIKDHREKGWTADEIERENRRELPTSLHLLDALNRRRNDAIQNLLGVSAEGLKKLFRQLRERLAARKQRLVLLLEDITSWEGIDDSLIDVLVTNAETRGDEQEHDMCPLISVVGVTPAYYSRLHGNYRGRITHELSLGKAAEAGSLQDVATLRDAPSRTAFAARYLAAVRTGEESLALWREHRRANHDLPPPNRCDDCEVREGCRQTFGAHDGISLYPFTADALERMFNALNEHDNGMTWKTPRGILQAILYPNLSRPQALEQGEFPTPLLENRSLVPESRMLSPRLSQTIDLQVNEFDRPRMKRLIAYWGDKERADTTLLDSGETAFAGVKRSVLEALGLPWIGDAAPVPASPAFAPTFTEESSPAPAAEELEQQPAEPRVSFPRAPNKPAAVPRTIGEPPSKRSSPTKSELEKQRDQLRKWRETGELESPTVWNQSLYSIVQKLEPRRVGLDPYSFQHLLTSGQVKFEGTGPANRNYFIVRPEPWVLDGLEGYIALRLDKSMTAQDAAFHWRNLSITMRRLEPLISTYADKRLTRLPEGQRWAPVAAFVQVLLARAWLRGGTVPTEQPHLQLKTILSDEREAESDPAARCTPWQEFLNRTNPWHDDWRRALREMLATPQGEARGFGLADVSLAAGAILRFRESLKFDPIPAQNIETGVDEFDTIRSVVDTTGPTLFAINRIERDQIRGRADTLRRNLRQRSIRAHFQRIDNDIDIVAKHLPGAAPDRVRDWKQSYARVTARLQSSTDAVEELLFTLTEDGDGPPARNGPLVEWLVRAPARDLSEFRDLSEKGEQVVALLLDHVRDCVDEGRGSASLEAIRIVGRKLRDAIRNDLVEPTREPV